MKLQLKEAIDYYMGNILIAMHILVARPIGMLLRRDHTLKEAPGCIIITKFLGLGSLLMAADAILAIKKRYPYAKLFLVCSKSLVQEASQLGLFDEVWRIDDSSFIKLVTSSVAILFKSWKHHRKWTVNLEVYSRLSTIFSLWTFAQNRFGFYFNEVRFRYMLNTHHMYFNPMALAYDNYEEMAKMLDAPVNEVYRIPVKQVDLGIAPGKKFIAINNNCSELAKERILPVDTMAAVISEVLDKYAYDIVLIGSKADKNANDSMMSHALLKDKDQIINIAGKYNFTDFLSLLKYQCVMMLTIDSGPLHFAYRLQLPTVSIWGPTHPDTRIPPSFKHETIYLHVHCSPCVHHTDVLPCGGDNFCMKNINTIQILNAVDKTLTGL